MLLAYIIRRILWSIPFLFVVSLIAFALIQAPPGDYITTFAATLAASGDQIDQDRLDALRERYGLDQPFLVQYWRWISGVLQGDFGISFEWQQPVSNLIWERMALSVTLALSTLAVHLGRRLPDRDLLGRPEILDRRLRRHRRSASSASPCRASWSRFS